jgi:hypothetical protein
MTQFTKPLKALGDDPRLDPINRFGVGLDAILEGLRRALREPYRRDLWSPIPTMGDVATQGRTFYFEVKGSAPRAMIAEILPEVAEDGDGAILPLHLASFRIGFAGDDTPFFEVPAVAVTGWAKEEMDLRAMLGVYGQPHHTTEAWLLGDVPHGPGLLAAVLSGYVVRREDTELANGDFAPTFQLTYEGRRFLAEAAADAPEGGLQRPGPLDYSTLVADDGQRVVFEHYTGRIAGGYVELDTGEPAGWVDLLTLPVSTSQHRVTGPITEDLEFIGIDGKRGKAASCAAAPSI